MKIACISDTHRPLVDFPWPEADVLIHAGDHTMQGSHREMGASLEWLAAAPIEKKFLVWGNHDLGTWPEPLLWRTHARDLGLTLLMPWEVNEFGGLRFVGSPYSSRIWGVWQLDRGEKARLHWSGIPEDADVLVTHGPPHGILDEVPGAWDGPMNDGHVGDLDLTERVKNLHLRLVVFGHIHEDGGKTLVEDGKIFVNAATLDGRYQNPRPPVVVEI